MRDWIEWTGYPQLLPILADSRVSNLLLPTVCRQLVGVVVICQVRSPDLETFLRSVYVPSRIDLGSDSIRQLAITIRVFQRWAGRVLTLDDLTEDLVRRFLCEYRQSHAAATTNSKRCQLLAIWRCAWDEGYLPQPPRAKRIRKARAAPAIPEAWTVEEVGRIFQAARQHAGRRIAGIPAADWWLSLLMVLYDTGERRGATLATSPSDVSLDDGWVVFRRTKTGLPRFCPIHAETVAAVRRIYDPCRSLLWPWPYSREALEKRVRKILRRAGVAYGRGRGGLLHKFRRTAGTLVEQAGGDGAAFIGDTRKIFEAHYKDPRFFDRSQLGRLPRP